jgi:hypothetical protein
MSVDDKICAKGRGDAMSDMIRDEDGEVEVCAYTLPPHAVLVMIETSAIEQFIEKLYADDEGNGFDADDFEAHVVVHPDGSALVMIETASERARQHWRRCGTGRGG